MNAKMALGALLCVGVVAPLFTGCATITRGTSEVLVVESEPSGAKVKLSNSMTGTTPTSFKIPRKGELHVTITKEGYETVEVFVNTQVAGAGAAGMAGNVLVGGIVGAGIDAFSGGMLEHKPNPIKVTLVPVATSVAAAAPAPAGVQEDPAPPPPVAEAEVPDAPASSEDTPAVDAPATDVAERPSS